MRAALLLTAASLVLAGTARTQAQPAAPGLQVYGPGSASCATYLGDRSLRINADGWILGFWTGFNFANEANHLVGITSDSRGIVGEVARICRSQPSVPLYMTVKSVYQTMAAEKR